MGYLDIIVASNLYYSHIKTYVATHTNGYNDDQTRHMWRTQQVYDLTHLMNYCLGRGKYYIQLEDDVMSRNGFMNVIKSSIQTFTSQNKTDWVVLELSELGFIGKLFKIEHLPIFMLFFLSFRYDQPIDTIFERILENKNCFIKNVKLMFILICLLFEYIRFMLFN